MSILAELRTFLKAENITMFSLRNFTKPTITRKILIGFMTVSLVPVLFIGYITYKTSEKEIREKTLEDLVAVAESKDVLFNEYIIGKEREVRELALTPTVISIMEKYHNAFHTGGADSREFIAQERKYRKYFIDYTREFGYYDLLLVDVDGNIFFTAKREDDFGANLYSTAYKGTGLAETFRQVMDTKKTYVSGLKYYLPSNMPALFIVAPVSNEGNIIGTIISQLSAEDIYETVQNYIGLGITGEIIIASRDGNEAVFITPLRHDPEAAFKRRVVLDSEEALPIQKAVQGEKGSGLSVDYRNKEILAVWRYLPRLRWGMVIKMDTDEVYKHIYNIRKWTSVVGVTTIIVVTLLAIRISRTLTRPIRELHKGSERIGHGNLDYKLGTVAKDEIGDLSRTFDKMIENLKTITASRDELNREVTIRKRIEKDLQKARNGLEIKVEERTTELQSTIERLNTEIIERKKAEEVLRLYERIVSSTDDHMSFVNRDYVYQAVNITYVKAHNKSIEEIVGHPVYELLGKELFEKTVKHNLDRCLDGEELNYQAWFDFSAFGRRFMDVSYYPFYEAEGSVSGVVVSSHDITELKKAQEALTSERERLFSLLERLPAFVYLQAPDHAIRYANRHFRDQFGDPEGKLCYDVLWGKKEPCKVCPTFRVFGTKEPQIWEWEDTPNGRVYEINDYPFTDIDGTDLVLELGFDITVRKKTENELRKREQQLKDSQKTAHLGSWELNLQTKDIIASDELYRIFDVHPETFKSTLEGFMHMVHPDDRESAEGVLNKSILEKEPFCTEARIIRANGLKRIIEARGDIVCDDSGEPILISGIAQDVTERKEVEEQIKDALREKAILLQEIHHRVKNNMMVITSLLQLQSKRIKDKRYREMFMDSINRINSMAFIHDKLYRSKDMANVNFDDYLKKMINSMILSYRSNFLKIEIKTDVDNVFLGVNTAIPCGLIINELISNSLKHAFPEGNEGEIRIALFTNDKAEIELTVSDNGVGIPENLDIRNTDSLGLTLVNALVAQLRGTIDLDREKGTRFVITFKG